MADEQKLTLGKGVAFVKSRLARPPQSHETWEADFPALPRPILQSETHYVGIVVVERSGALLADLTVHGRPSVNDLATLLAHAMRRPLDGSARRPRLIRVRGHRQWQELFPVLNELGIQVAVERKLPAIEKAYRALLRAVRDEQRVGMVRPTAEQAQVEALLPAIARFVRGAGYVEFGDQESFGFIVRAIDYGGVVFEDDTPDTLAEAMAVLEDGLRKSFAEQGEPLG